MVASAISLATDKRGHLQRLMPPPADEPLDLTAGHLGMGRSLTFPFPQWRAVDRYRTVYFDEGKGRPVVFLHGLGGNATHWEFVAQALASRYRVIGIDLVGCGWTAKPDQPYTIELLRDHVLEFLDRRGVIGATLVGHSLGGAVALAAALARPGEFDGLALLCAAGVAPVPVWMRMAAPLFLRRQILYPTLLYGADFIVKNVFVEDEAENPYVRWFRQSAMRDLPGYPALRDFARVCESLCWDVLRNDYAEHFPSLRLPVLALWGDHDKLTTLGPVLDHLQRIRRLRTVVLERCGHLPMVEHPEETTFHLERFLANPP
jgi:pimeloyl-ACP methyl ester carboxylesterase